MPKKQSIDDDPMFDTSPSAMDRATNRQLELFMQRIERLEEEKKGFADDIKDVYAEAKSQGYDTKTMRACIKLRKMQKDARDEADALLATYRDELGI